MNQGQRTVIPAAAKEVLKAFYEKGMKHVGSPLIQEASTKLLLSNKVIEVCFKAIKLTNPKCCNNVMLQKPARGNRKFVLLMLSGIHTSLHYLSFWIIYVAETKCWGSLRVTCLTSVSWCRRRGRGQGQLEVDNLLWRTPTGMAKRKLGLRRAELLQIHCPWFVQPCMVSGP